MGWNAALASMHKISLSRSAFYNETVRPNVKLNRTTEAYILYQKRKSATLKKYEHDRPSSHSLFSLPLSISSRAYV